MKKISVILYATVLCALVCACGNNEKFKIEGTAFNNARVYLYNGNELVDSTQAVGQAFVFEGKVTEPWLATIFADNDTVRGRMMVVVEHGKIAVNIEENHVEGTPMNVSLMAFNDATSDADLQGELNQYSQLYYSAHNAEARAEAERKYDSVDAIRMGRFFDAAQAMYNDNRDNILGAYAVSVMAETERLGYEELKAIVDEAADCVKNYEPVAARLEQMRCVEATSEGKHYVDIQGVDGKLSDLIDGKLALVDFYASWCGPCRAEIKDNIVPIWNKYKSKGLVVVGLNVWERGDAEARKAAHENVMANLGITYPQLVDSTRVATDTYGVRGIPQIMLIGPDGTILARDLRGAAIEEAILKAL